MNTEESDFILAVKNYENIVLSMPIPDVMISPTGVPEVYKIFLTISTLIRDYDVDFIKLIDEKWKTLDINEKMELLDMVNEGNCNLETNINLDAADIINNERNEYENL
jgi:hypothetical protein